jgi:hypothetical protein
VGCCIGLAQESRQERKFVTFRTLDTGRVVDFSTGIDAKTASTTVSDDNQLAMGVIETREWLIVGWGLCRGTETASMTSIMVKNRVHFSLHGKCFK